MKSELSSVLSKHIPIGKERCSILDNFKKKGWGFPVLRQNSIHMRFQQLRLSFSKPKISRSKFDPSVDGSLITAS
jgi:hypothetical protein